MPHRVCAGSRVDGSPCRNPPRPGSDFCRHHDPSRPTSGPLVTINMVEWCLERAACGAYYLSGRDRTPHHSPILPSQPQGPEQPSWLLFGEGPELQDLKLGITLAGILQSSAPLYCRTPGIHQELRSWLTDPDFRSTILQPYGDTGWSKRLVNRILPGPPPWAVPTQEPLFPWLPYRGEQGGGVPAPRPPDAFPNGQGQIANNPVVFAGMKAIWAGGRDARKLTSGWIEGAGGPVFQHLATGQARGGQITVYPNPARKPSDPLPTVDTLWAWVERLSPFTGDVALAVLAQMCEPSAGDKPKYPLLQPVPITAESIARYKGIQRYGKEMRLLLESIHDEMEALRAMHFDVLSYPAHDPESGRWQGRGFTWEGDRFFDIVKVEAVQPSLYSDSRDVIETAWSVRAGQWAHYWFNPQARVYIGRMARALLELPHQGRGARAMAKKIGQRVLLIGDGYHKLTFDLRIGDLLEDIGELPRPEARSRNWAARAREEFDEAMLALSESKLFESVDWPEGHGPLDPPMARGWVDPWLNAKVCITLPGEAPALPPPPPASKRLTARKARQVVSQRGIDGPGIRRVREASHWHQETLAQHLGVSREYLSKIESGKRLPSPRLATKIREWLDQAGTTESAG